MLGARLDPSRWASLYFHAIWVRPRQYIYPGWNLEISDAGWLHWSLDRAVLAWTI